MEQIESLIALLSLEPHPEGGFFRESYRSSETIRGEFLPERYVGSRPFSTAIYYLITKDSFSAIHRLNSDEIIHFYLGDPVELLALKADGSGEVFTLGHNLPKGMRVQLVVEKGTWFGMRVANGGEYALLGTTVAPGFEYSDFELGERDTLVSLYPSYEDMIKCLTRY
jgi:predicted cupin superfamily sugar epimerase